MRYEKTLRKYQRTGAALSGEPVKSGLLADLKAQKRFNSILYSVLFVAICSVSIATIMALFTDLVQAGTQRTLILSGAGVTVPGALEWLRRTVREWSQLNLLITLVARSDEDAIQELIRKLLSSKSIGLA